MRYTRGNFEIGRVNGPWIKIGRYEIGIGRHTVTDVGLIPYEDSDGNDNSVMLTGTPRLADDWKYLGRKTTLSGGWTRAFSFGGRTLYLMEHPR